MIEGYKHIPVLLKEILEFLNFRPGRIYVDATVGEGGHAQAILERIYPGGKLIGIDLDKDALAVARKRLEKFGNSVVLVEGNFKDLDSILARLEIRRVEGMLFDLGISSFQLASGRGFSFQEGGSLDMRLDKNSPFTASQLINTLPPQKLIHILHQYGEEYQAPEIAKEILRERKRSPIETVPHLVEIIKKVKKRRGRIHPATKVFQALRIAVNQELENLWTVLGKIPSLLTPGGRVAIISFHSLEDRMVKNSLRSWEKEGMKIITPKPVRPTFQDMKANPRSRSAKLRVAEKI